MIHDIRATNDTAQATFRKGSDRRRRTKFSALVDSDDEVALPGAAQAGLRELSRRLGLDLTDSLPRNGALLPEFFERMHVANKQTHPHPDDPLFNWGEEKQKARRAANQAKINSALKGEESPHSFDEAA